MNEVRKYILVNQNGESELGEYDSLREAIESATDGQSVLAHVYEFNKAEIAWENPAERFERLRGEMATSDSTERKAELREQMKRVNAEDLALQRLRSLTTRNP